MKTRPAPPAGPLAAYGAFFQAGPQERISDWARKIQAQYALRAWLALTDTLTTRNAESVHDLRVAIRHVRFGFRQFRAYLPGGKRVSAALAKIAQQAAVVREADILVGTLKKYFSQFQIFPETCNQILRRVTAVRQDAFTLFYAKASGPMASKIFLELIALLEKNGTSGQPAKNYGRQVLSRLAKKCRARLSKTRHTFKPGQIHQLRLDCKNLRYACEYFAPLFPGKMLKFIKHWAMVQDALGAYQDLRVSQQHVLAMLPQLLPGEEYLLMSTTGYWLQEQAARRRQHCLRSSREWINRLRKFENWVKK